MVEIKNKRMQMRIQKSDDLWLLNCRGQLRIKQMTFMLLAVVLFFIIVGLFTIVFVFGNLKEDATRLNKEQAISIASRLAGNTEFSCGKDYCINSDKLMALKNMPVYNGLWGVSSIEVWKLGNESRECSLSNYPNCGVFKVIDNNESNQVFIPLFVSICRKAYENNYIYDKCELGKLLIGYKVER